MNYPIECKRHRGHYFFPPAVCVACYDEANDARVAALEAQLADADARINEQDALLKEWQSGTKVQKLEAALKLAEEALEKSRDQDWVENCLDPQWAANKAGEALAREVGEAYESLVYQWVDIGQETRICRFCGERGREHDANCPHGIRLTKLRAAGLLPGKEG